MKSFFNPSVKLINKLNFTKKFLLLFCLIILIIIPLMYQTLTPLLRDRALSKKELIGLDLVEVLYDLRRELFININFLTALKDDDDKEKLIEEITDKINQIEDQITKSNLGQITGVKEIFLKLKSEWEVEKNNFNTNISNEIDELISNTCTNANLILDPDIDTSFLTDAICVKLNHYSEFVSRLKELGIDILNKNTQSQNFRDNLLNAKAAMNYYASEIKSDVDTAMNYNPSIEKHLKEIINEYFDRIKQANDKAASVLKGEAVDVSVEKFFRRFTGLILTSYEIQKRLIDESRQLIQLRIRKNNQIIVSNVSVVIITLLLFSYFFIGIYYSILGGITQLVFGSKKISEGDLNFKLKLESTDELMKVGESFNLMRDSLEKLVKNIKKASQKIKKSSDEIAMGNSDLAKRTLTQTTSLEETSTSMEKIAKSVQKNTDNAKESYLSAESAKRNAEEGNRVINEMSNMMQDISRSAEEITDIIEVLDDLASQTNILSLNAAVEAARAGDEGRGFSVIADEIQNLSKRSGESAHGIKKLIQDSVERVKEFSKLTEKALKSIEQITSSFNIVSSMLSQISSTSVEDNERIQQISKVINEIGKVNQENNLLVDTVNQTAKSLQEEAKHMMAEINVFKIHTSNDTPIQNPPP